MSLKDFGQAPGGGGITDRVQSPLVDIHKRHILAVPGLRLGEQPFS